MNGWMRNINGNDGSGGNERGGVGEATNTSLRSLEEVHGSVNVQHRSVWRRLFAYAGPAYLISVGYMDPGNWATDLEGGARFGYKLIWVLLMANLMAVLLQTLSARLGLAGGCDLAQACRDNYGPLVRWPLFVLCEIAIAACDLAEVLGTAIGLNLLLGIPLLPAVLVTVADVFLLLAIQRLGMRRMEAFIVWLIAVIGLCFVLELLLSKPSLSGLARGFVPGRLSGGELYIAIGILGATVMPHNLYLHSALVQTRAVKRLPGSIAQACRYNLVDSAIALNAAFLVNAAILAVAAATFFSQGVLVTEIQQAHQLLDDLLGSQVAPVAFAVALICAGQSSTLTGTLAGQVTMEGFLHLRLRPWVRRLVTRLIAITPAVVVIAYMGDEGTYRLLILSQVILSLQLPFAVAPLVRFTCSRRIMGRFVSPWWVRILAWGVAALIIGLNAKLVQEELLGWAGAAGPWQWAVWAAALPVVGGLAVLLGYLIVHPMRGPTEAGESGPAAAVASVALKGSRPVQRIGVALDAGSSDAAMLAEAVGLARARGAQLWLLHVVEGTATQVHGADADDAERAGDERYLTDLAQRLTQRLAEDGLPPVSTDLGYGQVVPELVRMVRDHQLDLLVMGGHGHRGLQDLLRGQTIPGVRHKLNTPILIVKPKAETKS
jgi:manganese transport protein